MVLSPEVDEEGVTGVVGRITEFITGQGGSITRQENWGLRRLAYPIQKFREGNYVLAQMTLEPSVTRELEENIKASGEVLRYLLVKT
jgi:small subunit ribosomal protein S6